MGMPNQALFGFLKCSALFSSAESRACHLGGGLPFLRTQLGRGRSSVGRASRSQAVQVCFPPFSPNCPPLPSLVQAANRRRLTYIDGLVLSGPLCLENQPPGVTIGGDNVSVNLSLPGSEQAV